MTKWFDYFDAFYWCQYMVFVSGVVIGVTDDDLAVAKSIATKLTKSVAIDVATCVSMTIYRWPLILPHYGS